MTALRKILIEEEPVVAETVTWAPAAKLYVVTTNAEPRIATRDEAGNALKDIVLFFLAPFIGLAYVIALPFVGLGVVALLAARVVTKMEAVKTIGLALKTVGLVIAAPVLGLAYAVFFPFIGLGVLTWLGGRAMVAAMAR
jgi:hypothetical protein